VEFSAIQINPMPFVTEQSLIPFSVVKRNPLPLIKIEPSVAMILRKDFNDWAGGGISFHHARLPKNDTGSRGQGKLDWQDV
jgi:hypothetical protein